MKAFSLLGAPASWQTEVIGYDPGQGPHNLGREYRLNVPRLFYAFDESFLNYFGQRGVEEVEKAIKILNDLPPVSEIDIDDYPLYATRVNHRAEAAQLTDLKSQTLKALVEMMGLADPTRYVFTLRSRSALPTNTNYWVIKRNFDPITWEPSSFINGQLWTYNDIFDVQPPPGPSAYPINVPVDPLLLAEPVATMGWTFSRFSVGSYHTGLTRDDVGGLKYIYHPNNANGELPPPNVPTNAAAGIATGGFLQTSDNPWGIPPILTTLNTNTNTTATIIPDPNNPWQPPTIITTNAPGGAVVPAGQPLPPIFTNNAAIRRGIDHVEFVRTEFSPVTGQFYQPFLDQYSEQAIAPNGQLATVQTTRVMSRPDLLFTARDLEGAGQLLVNNFTTIGNFTVWFPDTGNLGTGTDDTFITWASFLQWTNNDTLNGIELATGPGVQVAEGLRVIFSNVGPVFFNVYTGPGSFLAEQPFSEFLWGAFDGSTNEPFVFPQGTTIQEIEDQIFGGR